MFTISTDTALTTDIIKQAISYNREQKENHEWNKLAKYYIGRQRIVNRVKPDTAKNNKLVINHAQYITDSYVGFMLGNPCEWRVLSSNKKINIDKIKKEFADQDIASFDVLLAEKISIFGSAYELVYTSGNNVRSTFIDPRNAVCIYDDTVEHKLLYGIIYGDDFFTTTKETKVTVFDDNVERTFETKQGELVLIDEKLHGFKRIPLIRYKNNDEELGDFQQVLSLIDAYNLLQSDRVNDKEQLVEAILAGYGIEMDEEKMQKLRVNRNLFNLPIDSRLEYLVKQLDEESVNILRKNLEDDIFKISKVPNMTDENFLGNLSGVALRYKLLPFEQNTRKKERYFEKGLKERFTVYNGYLVNINAMSEVPATEVDVVFKGHMPQNILELTQIINNLEGLVDKETLVSLLPFVKDAKETIAKAQEEEMETALEEEPNFGKDNSEE